MQSAQTEPVASVSSPNAKPSSSATESTPEQPLDLSAKPSNAPMFHQHDSKQVYRWAFYLCVFFISFNLTEVNYTVQVVAQYCLNETKIESPKWSLASGIYKTKSFVACGTIRLWIKVLIHCNLKNRFHKVSTKLKTLNKKKKKKSSNKLSNHTRNFIIFMQLNVDLSYVCVKVS